jgi:transcriptional regulator with XRE-family HTH domain
MREKEEGWVALGDFIRGQRRLHAMSLRQLADVAKVSNPYLSQVERGLYRPSVDVLKNIATALKLSTETLLSQAGLVPDPLAGKLDVENAICLDPDLSPTQKETMLTVYRSFRAGAVAAAPVLRAARPRAAKRTRPRPRKPV